MKKFKFLLATAILFISFTVNAQEKWTVEFRPGLNFPTGDVGDIDTKIGSGYELTGAYNILPHLAFYAGWGWNEFKGKDNQSTENFTLEEKGYTFGFQIKRKIGTSSLSYLARVGAVYNHIKLEDNMDVSADTGYGFGWQAALGVDFEFVPNLSLRPMLRYRSLSRDVEVANVSNELNLNYISFGIGLAWDFDF